MGKEKNNKYRTSFHINRGNYQKLKFLSVAKNKKIADCINEAIEDYLKKNSKILKQLGLIKDGN